MERTRHLNRLKSTFDNHYILEEWKDVHELVVDYFTLEGRIAVVLSLHITVMNHFLERELNFGYFLSHSLKRSMERERFSKHGIPIHQGLIKLVYDSTLESIPPFSIGNQ